MNNTHEVFISYSNKDKGIADAICHTLEEHGICCWIAPRDVSPGVPYAREIIDGIRKCKVMILVYSKNANDSQHVVNEIDQAFTEEKTIIPFMVDATSMNEELNYYLARRHWLVAYPNYAEKYEELAEAVANVLKKDYVHHVTAPVERPKDVANVPVLPTKSIMSKLDVAKKMNIMDKYPEYNFIPTNLIDWKKPWVASIVLYVLLITSLFLFGYSVISWFSYESHSEMYYHEYSDNSGEGIGEPYWSVRVYDWFDWVYSGYDASTEFEARSLAIQYYHNNLLTFIISFGFIALIPILLFIFFRPKWPSKDNDISKCADYVQKYRYNGFLQCSRRSVLRFYAIDNMMGLLDVAHYRVYLKAQYDKLEWREKNKYLNATLGNETFIIDKNGNRLK